jgi:hypothetical protein
MKLRFIDMFWACVDKIAPPASRCHSTKVEGKLPGDGLDC